MGSSYHSKLGFKEWKYQITCGKEAGSVWKGVETMTWLLSQCKTQRRFDRLTCLSLHTVVPCGPTQISACTRDSYQSQEQWKKVLCKINTSGMWHVLDWGCVLSATWKCSSSPTLSNSLSENLSVGKMPFFPLKFNLKEFLFITLFFSPAVTHSMLLTSIQPQGIIKWYSQNYSWLYLWD